MFSKRIRPTGETRGNDLSVTTIVPFYNFKTVFSPFICLVVIEVTHNAKLQHFSLKSPFFLITVKLVPDNNEHQQRATRRGRRPHGQRWGSFFTHAATWLKANRGLTPALVQPVRLIRTIVCGIRLWQLRRSPAARVAAPA